MTSFSHPKKLSIVISCIDYRFWPQALPLLKKKYGEFDLIEMAGASKNLASPLEEQDKIAILENIDIAAKLHHSQRLILTNHMDCGAYGGSKIFKSKEEEIQFHKKELAKAKKIVQKKFPGLIVKTEFLVISKDKNKIKLYAR